MSDNKFITDALIVFAESTSSFRVAFEDAGSFRRFLSEFGWELEPNIDEASFTKVHDAFSAEIILLGQMDGNDVQKAIAASGLIATLMSGRTGDASWPAPLNSSLFWSDFPSQLFDSFIWQMIQRGSALAFALLRFGAVFREEEQDIVVPTGGVSSRLSYLKRSIDWEQFVNFLADPENAFKTAYNWNNSSGNFHVEALLKAISAMFEILPISSVVMDAPKTLYDKYFDSSLPTSPKKIEMLTVMPYMLRNSNGVPIDLLKVSLNAIPIPYEGTNTGKPFGIALFPIISGSAQVSLSLGKGITLLLNGKYSSTPVIGEIRPNSVAIKLPGINETLLSGSAKVEAENEASPWVIIGSSDGPRFEVSKAHVEIAMSGTIQNPIFTIATALDKATIVIDFSSGDGFLQKLFGDSPQRINAELSVSWSNQSGFQISGGAVLDLTIPVHETLFNTIAIDCIKIKLSTNAIDLKTYFNAGIVASLKLGPIAASVNNVGFKLGVKPTIDGSGNIGIFDVSLGFLSPTGIGFSIDAEGLVGGGFIDYDDDLKRYSGALALKFGNIGITAIGLITTRLPGDVDGFSMLVSICVTFSPPIQIYMGFTLSGVGGLIGINRTMNTDVLRDGLKKGTLDSILFPAPETVIPNANQIISDMRAVFPPEDGHFIVGPMIQVGWGSPNIIVGEIGVFLEFTLPLDPVRIVLMGQVQMSLPDPTAEIVGVHIDILGVLDFEKKELSFQAAIYGSSMMAFKLYGGCAFFLRWGDKPELAFALGGFHPKFTPPPPRTIFEGLSRLGVNINYGPVVQLRCIGYMALTPNSLQFGARVEVFVGVEAVDAGITGFLSFDALFYFSPFFFEVGIGGGVSIGVMGVTLADIRLSATLSGPTPWTIEGKATVHVLFFDIDCGFNISWGETTPALPTPVDPWPALKEAFQRAESWGSQLPVGTSLVESLRTIEDEPIVQAEDEPPVPAPVVVHPAGTLEVRENVVPLETTLAKFGNAPVLNYDRFRIVDLQTGDGDHLNVSSVKEFFSRGQFENLSNHQKLSIPSFEKMPGGGTMAASNRIKFVGDRPNQKVGYESILIRGDRTAQPPSNSHAATIQWSNARVLSAGNAARRGALRSQGKARFSTPKMSMVSTEEEKYVVVNAETLIPISFDSRVDIPDDGMTRVQADQALAQHLGFSKGQPEKHAVVAEYEIEEAA